MSILDQHDADRAAQADEAEARADHHQFTEAHRRDPMRAVLRAEKARDDAVRIARENDLDGAA